jgi:hypothetical protein
MRALGVPLLGLSIPQVTGALKPLTWEQPGYWLGVVLFLVFAFVVWQGNRWILLQLRDRFDWLQRPRQRIAALLVATFLYTVPSTLVAVILWYKLGPIGEVNWAAVVSSTFLVEISVIGVTNIYETWFLVTDRFEDRLRLERNERRRVEMELNGLKSQLAPHFLFNCLNTLNVLIAEDPAAARSFTQNMASVCRYLLEQQRRELVPLHEERDFFDAYAAMARLRFPTGLQIDVVGFESTAGLLIPPASLQLLLENAIKHNGISDKAPLQGDRDARGRHPHLQQPPAFRARPAAFDPGRVEEPARTLPAHRRPRVDRRQERRLFPRRAAPRAQLRGLTSHCEGREASPPSRWLASVLCPWSWVVQLNLF